MHSLYLHPTNMLKTLFQVSDPKTTNALQNVQAFARQADEKTSQQQAARQAANQQASQNEAGARQAAKQRQLQWWIDRLEAVRAEAINQGDSAKARNVAAEIATAKAGKLMFGFWLGVAILAVDAAAFVKGALRLL